PETAHKIGHMRTIMTSIVTAMITAALIGYLSIMFSVEDMTIFYRAGNLMNAGEGKLSVAYSVANMGRQGSLIEELGLIQVVGDKISDDDCDNAELLSNLGSVDDGGTLRLATGKEFSYHVPSQVLIDNRTAITSSIALNAGTTKKMDVVFGLAPFDMHKKAVLLCPVVKYFDRGGRAVQSICPGWTSEPAGNAGVTLGRNIGLDSLRLLPRKGSFLNFLFWRSSKSFCVSRN
ncbi:MAG: hypothetical protein ACRECA_06555, partial [Pseudolabrys sp.]